MWYSASRCVSDEIKYSLLTCDEFLAHMRTWLVPETATENQAALPVTEQNRSWPVVQADEIAAEPLAADPLGPSPILRRAFSEDGRYGNSDEDEAELFSQSGIQSLFHSARKFGRGPEIPRRKPVRPHFGCVRGVSCSGLRFQSAHRA